MTSASNIIALMTSLIASMTPIVTITTNVADGTNWKLEMCNTYWLNTGTIITIGGLPFTIVSFVQDDYIIVSGTAQPIGTTFQLDAPVFQHGNHRKVSGERQSPTDLTVPFIYLPTPDTREDLNFDSDLAYTATINPFFLMSFDKNKDEIDLQQAEIIDPVNAMVDFFIDRIVANDADYEELTFDTRKEWMNFGNPALWGNDKLIFEDDLSGVELKIDVEVMRGNSCECDNVPVKVCLDVTGTFNGTAIEPQISGGSKIIVVQTDDAIPVQTGVALVDTADNLTIEVAAPTPVINTSTYLVTGQVTSFRTGDDGSTQRGRSNSVLSGNNPFGNTNRFTDFIGTQIYTNDIVLDWGSYDQTTGGSVLGIYRIPQTGKDWNTQIDDALLLTIATFGGWALINESELSALLRREGLNTDFLNYAPFNIQVTGTAERIHTGSRADISTRNLQLIENGNILGSNKTTVCSGLVVRYFTLTQLGL